MQLFSKGILSLEKFDDLNKTLNKMSLTSKEIQDKNESLREDNNNLQIEVEKHKQM